MSQVRPVIERGGFELLELLRREALGNSAGNSRLPVRPASLLELSKFAGLSIGVHLREQGHPVAAWREVAFDLGFPFRLVALSQRRLLVFGELLDRLLSLDQFPSPTILPPGPPRA